MSTITPDAPIRGARYVVAVEKPGGYGLDDYYERVESDYRLAKGDVVEVLEGGELDSDGDVYVTIVRTGKRTYVRFADLAPEPEAAPPISEVDVAAFVESIGIETETVEVPAILDALTSLGMAASYAEAAVALAQRRSAR